MSTETTMQLLKLDFAPGFHRESTQYEEEGNWYDGDRPVLREPREKTMRKDTTKSIVSSSATSREIALPEK